VQDFLQAGCPFFSPTTSLKALKGAHGRPVARIVKTRRQTGRAPHPLPSPSFPLEVGPLNPARGSGERCKLPSGVWVRAPAEIEFGAF